MLYIILGKSGSGKSEIAKNFIQLIAFTTRDKRDDEIDGIEYYFKNRDYIELEIKKFNNNEKSSIIEYGEYCGSYYGTLDFEFYEKTKNNEIIVNTSEIRGALIMKNKFPDKVKLIWVDVLEDVRLERLKNRKIKTKETDKDLLKRVNEDYRNKEKELCDFIIHNNSDVENAVFQIKDLHEKITN
ncbi:Guanylate kinase [compost metagenome]